MTSRPPLALALVALYFATTAVFADMYITQPLLPQLAREFGVDAAVAGATISAVVLTTALSSAFYGPLSEVLGRRRVMVWGSAALALATAACAWAPTLSALIALRALQGLLVPSVSAIAVAYLYEDLATVNPAMLVGGYVASSVLGGLIGRVLGASIADAWDWRASFCCFAALTVAGTLALAATVRSRPPRPARIIASDLRTTFTAMFAHVHDVRLVGAFAIGAALFFAFIGVFTYLPFYVTAKPFDLSTSAVSWLYMSCLAGVAVSPIAVRLAGHLSARLVMAAGITIAILGIALSLDHNLLAVIASCVILYAGMFIAQPIAPTFVAATAPATKGSATALYQSFYYLGAVFGSVLPGFAWERWAWPGVVTTCIAALVVALLANWILCGRRITVSAAV
jgi:MFS transporter, YNFM family, putative membrane transport protein